MTAVWKLAKQTSVSYENVNLDLLNLLRAVL